MFSVHLYKKLFQRKHFVANSTAARIFHPQNLFPVGFSSLVELSVVSSRTASRKNRSDEKLEEKQSFTVSYLINSCGLSPEKAASVSSKLILKDPEKPNSVLALLESYGFSKTQITTVVRIRPTILVSKEKSLLPKLEFFQSIGMSKPLLATLIAKDPGWLHRSLKNFIIPNYHFLKSVLLTDEKVATAFKLLSRVFSVINVSKFAANINTLRELRVPESCIRYVLTYYPETLLIKTEDFEESVSEVLQMGFDPLKIMFVLALHILSGDANKVSWARCYETYSNWGWSREDIYTAFRKHPNCMIMSQKKINGTMDFLVNKFGLNSRVIAESPAVLVYNLENRIVPRCSVIQVLSSRDLLKKQFKLATFLLPAEKSFLGRFVVPFEKDVPKLYDFYKGKVGIEEL